VRKKLHRPHRFGWDGRKWVDAKDKNHRINGPALKFDDGYKSWYVHGVRHHWDGSDVEHPSGRLAWYEEGRLKNEINGTGVF